MHVDTYAISWGGDIYQITNINERRHYYVAMRPIAESLGLQWPRAMVSLIQDPRFQPQPFFNKQDQAEWLWSLPLHALQLWLETVSVSDVVQANHLSAVARLGRMKKHLLHALENTIADNQGGHHDEA